jgi:hypothetical protein
MNRGSGFSPYHQGSSTTQNRSRVAQGVADFLRSHDRMSTLLPAVLRMAALRQDCAALLPEMFSACEILQMEAGSLVLSVQNAALASKLKQRLPNLQEGLAKRGWQVNAIRIKVQVERPVEKPAQPPKAELPHNAVVAFATLAESLENTGRNEELKAALRALVRHHGDKLPGEL